jgi:hypothetical protein
MKKEPLKRPIPPPTLIIREGEDPRIAMGLPRELPIHGKHILDSDIRLRLKWERFISKISAIFA